MAFLISDVLFTEIYAFILMNLDMGERRLRLYFPIGSSLITLLLPFSIFVLVMRGWGKLQRFLPLGKAYAILLTTCFFVIYHYNNPVNMLLSFAMGLVFAHMVMKAKGILPAIIFHIGINLLGQVILPSILTVIMPGLA